MDWTLYIGGHSGTEASAFADVPRECASKLHAMRRHREIRRLYEATGREIWYARAENGRESVWLEDNRGTLRQRHAV